MTKKLTTHESLRKRVESRIYRILLKYLDPSQLPISYNKAKIAMQGYNALEKGRSLSAVAKAVENMKPEQDLMNDPIIRQRVIELSEQSAQPDNTTDTTGSAS